MHLGKNRSKRGEIKERQGRIGETNVFIVLPRGGRDRRKRTDRSTGPHSSPGHLHFQERALAGLSHKGKCPKHTLSGYVYQTELMLRLFKTLGPKLRNWSFKICKQLWFKSRMWLELIRWDRERIVSWRKWQTSFFILRLIPAFCHFCESKWQFSNGSSGTEPVWDSLNNLELKYLIFYE